MKRFVFWFCQGALGAGLTCAADERLEIYGGFTHIRNVEEREWGDWPEKAEENGLEVRFEVANPKGWRSLKWRQDGAKERWEIAINGKRIGTLYADDKDQGSDLALPEGALLEGENVLTVRTKSAKPDDIRVGEFWLGKDGPGKMANGGKISVTVKESGVGGGLPSRITVVDSRGSLARIGAVSDDRLAVRSGVVYTVDGTAEFGLEPGKYTVYAGRGFEYGVDWLEIEVKRGGELVVPLEIKREVDTSGWVACDTHLHSFTYARHGDATFTERMIAIAGEGIELPVSTEHNQHIDYVPEMRRLGLGKWMTPVLGNEVTTDVGHFNIWPVKAGSEPPMTKLRPWPQIFKNIYATPGVRVCILNHPADTHRGFMPFGSDHFVPVTGENLDGWKLEANAVEVINSGALNHDPLEVVRSWMGLLNAGQKVTPVGCSDSHSVSFSIAGQGRTYIRGDDSDPGEIDIDQMADHFLEGNVCVSMGLFADVRVNGKAGPGETVATKWVNHVEVTVRAPSWAVAERVLLFANGEKIADRKLVEKPREDGGGKQWKVSVNVPIATQDTHLVAVALGPGIGGAYWPSKRPYQRESIDFTPYVIAVTGAVWIEDGDGKRTFPAEHGADAVENAGGDLGKLVESLGTYDAATAAHAAMRFVKAGGTVEREKLDGAPEKVRNGFEGYLKAVGK